MERIKSFIEAWGKSSEERAEVKKLRETESLFRAALENAGVGYILDEYNMEKSTGIRFSKKLEEYPYDMQMVIEGYMESSNDAILQYAITCKHDKNSPYKRIKIGEVSEKQRVDAERLLHMDFGGYQNAVERSAINHIEKRHGESGEADKSMRNLHDVARDGFVLDNYDTVELTLDSDGNERFSKQFRTRIIIRYLF